MKKEIQLFLDKFNDGYKRRYMWKKIVLILSCFVFVITTYFLIMPGITMTEENPSYIFHLKDSYDYSWKENLITEYNLKLYFMDTDGNYIEGKNLELDIGPSNFADDPYGFGYVPISGDTTRGLNLIKSLGMDEYVLSTGEKYEFHHMEVYINDVWQTFSSESKHWDIWCQYASSTELKDDYGWRGKYGDNIPYMINDNTEYKIVYKLVRYGQDNVVSSLGADSGILFNIFNYSGNNTQTGINDNGLWNYFTFRNSSLEDPVTINKDTDEDGYTNNHAKVLPNLEDGYPVFDCRGYCINKSLGYLFGSSVNSFGEVPKGVSGYSPVNTLLQTEIIDGVEYYYYDSNRNAVDYDMENNRFMVRDYVERGSGMSSYLNETARYEFLPFNYWNSNREVITTDSGFSYNYDRSEIDYWFGMTMEFSFYMPKDGIINGNDMIFSFSGDDDVWVFVDDVLVLDLGGTHGAVDGTINFKTGEVSGYLNWNATVGTSNNTSLYEMFSNANVVDSVSWNEDNTTFDDYSLHTVKFFYLERGAAVTNCKIRFNIPVLPSGSLSVQKQFEGQSKYEDDYEFTLYDVTDGNKIALGNIKYVVGDNEFYTNSNGKFTLKNGEVAIFKLTNYHKYYVAETNAGDYAVSFKCVFDGVECDDVDKTNVFTIEPSSAYQAIFTNKVKTFNLRVSKIAYASEDDELFKFKVSFRDEDGVVVDVSNNIETSNEYVIDNSDGNITYSLKNGDYIVIKDIPIDTEITLQEIFHDGYTTVIKTGEIVLKEGDTYKFIMDSDKDITVYNIPGVVLPETGGIGICGYVLGGIILIFNSLWFGYNYLYKLKEGVYR